MIISKTPLRASFFGGGSDFSEFYENTKLGYGSTLSTTINMYVYIMVNRRFDDKIRISYRIQELVDHVDEIQHNIVREAMKIAGIDHGVDIVYSADIPISTSGVGLASSSAMAVGVLNALFAYQGIKLSPSRLAQYACEIEIDRMKNPIGIQDQYAVSFGGLKKYKYLQQGDVEVSAVVAKKADIEKLQKRLMLFYTGVNRVSSTILSDQRNKIRNTMPVIEEMVGMVSNAETMIAEGRMDDFGNYLDKAWELKKQMTGKISNSLIDDMYSSSKKAGALGGKILGAGGGGFLMLYVPEEKQEKVRNSLYNYREVDFKFENSGSQIIFME